MLVEIEVLKFLVKFAVLVCEFNVYVYFNRGLNDRA
jgi:hypothetical protein